MKTGEHDFGAAFDGDGVGASAFTWTLMRCTNVPSGGKQGPAAWSAVSLIAPGVGAQLLEDPLTG